MRLITDQVQSKAIAKTLAVILPGAYGTPEDLQREGFIAAVRKRMLPIDVLLADTNLECITREAAFASLRGTVIEPARAVGYRHIWLIGISIGAFAAMAYADQCPDLIDGLCLIAPYPGNRMIIAEVRSQGIFDWRPGPIAEDDYERRIWLWLKDAARHPKTVHLGYGRDHRFSAAHSTMAVLLPPKQVHVLPGAHDWPTRRAIWASMPDAGAIAC